MLPFLLSGHSISMDHRAFVEHKQVNTETNHLDFKPNPKLQKLARHLKSLDTVSRWEDDD